MHKQSQSLAYEICLSRYTLYERAGEVYISHDPSWCGRFNLHLTETLHHLKELCPNSLRVYKTTLTLRDYSIHYAHKLMHTQKKRCS